MLMSPEKHGEPGETASFYACALVSQPLESEPSAAAMTRERLLAVCRAVTERVAPARLRGAWGAALDLGRCSAEEARVVCADLVARLARADFAARVGVGPTLTLARLAALTCAADDASGAIVLVGPAERALFTQALPVDVLAHLEPDAITPEVITRLRHYGLRTFGQVARLGARDPHILSRQFGRAGAVLASLACGNDTQTVQASPAPERLTARRRFISAATVDQALDAVPALAASLTRRLDARSQQAQLVEAHIVWDSGAESRARRQLARPLRQPAELAQAARSLLTSLLATLLPSGGHEARSAALVISLAVTLGDCSFRLPARPVALLALASAQPERSAAQERIARLAVEVAEPLARRYGSPALYRLDAHQPDAILPEERLRLVSLKSSDSTDPHAERAPGSRRAQRARAADKALGLSRATPPQPHWW